MAARSWGAGGARVRGGRQPGRDLDEARPDRGPGLRPATLWGRAHFPTQSGCVARTRPTDRKSAFLGSRLRSSFQLEAPRSPGPVLVGGRAEQVGGVSLLRGGPGPEAACGPSHGSPLARTVLLAVARPQRWEADAPSSLGSGLPPAGLGAGHACSELRATPVPHGSGRASHAGPHTGGLGAHICSGWRSPAWGLGQRPTPHTPRLTSSQLRPLPCRGPHLRASLSVQKMGRRRPLLPPSPSNQMPRNASEQ